MNKKLFFLLSLAGYCLISIAGTPDSSWIVSNEGKFIVSKMSIRDTKARLVLENGKKMIIAIDQIKVYSLDGKVFKKLPLYIDGKCTNQMVFMELVKAKGELMLYKHSSWSYNPNKKITNFLLYNGDQLLMEYDEKSCH